YVAGGEATALTELLFGAKKRAATAISNNASLTWMLMGDTKSRPSRTGTISERSKSYSGSDDVSTTIMHAYSEIVMDGVPAGYIRLSQMYMVGAGFQKCLTGV